ncbi:MAG TPA: OmpA family protein [Terriglobia bacterium]|nr:OmpA family protein [Terriglobia bacterium]
MNRLHSTMSGILALGFFGFLSFGNAAFAEQVSRQQILEALTAQPKVMSLADKLRLNRSLTLASVEPRQTIDLEVYFDYNSAEITSKAEPQLDELGAALADPKLSGATISINGHTDGIGGDAFNKKLSERRAAMIKEYLVDNFQLSPSNLRTIGYGKTRPKNKMDPNAPENRRVEVVNETPRTHAQR